MHIMHLRNLHCMYLIKNKNIKFFVSIWNVSKFLIFIQCDHNNMFKTQIIIQTRFLTTRLLRNINFYH